MSQFSGLKINKSKHEVAGIGVMKGVEVALCGVECVNLQTNTIKILGIHFSYNKKIENEKNFLDHITKLQFKHKENAKFSQDLLRSYCVIFLSLEVISSLVSYN